MQLKLEPTTYFELFKLLGLSTNQRTGAGHVTDVTAVLKDVTRKPDYSGSRKRLKRYVLPFCPTKTSIWYPFTDIVPVRITRCPFSRDMAEMAEALES